MKNATNEKSMTFKEMKEFNGVWKTMKALTPTLEQTKFGYAVKRFLDKNIIPVFDQYNEKLSIIRIENALEDANTKAVITKNDAIMGGRGFEYSRDGLKTVIKEEIKLDAEWDPKSFKIEPVVAKDVPKLTEEQTDTFKGRVI